MKFNMKEIGGFLIIYASIIGVTVLSLSYATSELIGYFDEKTITIDYTKLQSKWYEEGETRDFIILASRFARTHEFVEDIYDCTNYTVNLKKIADELGFNTETIVGCPENKSASCHAWLRLKVDFEPQTGEFIDYSLVYPNQEVVG